jgi:urease accessory protein
MRAATSICMTTTSLTRTAITIMAEAAATLRLLAWLSPAFPTGAYAYSHGVEWAVDVGDISDGATLQTWIEDVLRLGAGRTDAILLRHAHRAHGDIDLLAELAELALATAPTRERQAESIVQGNAFAAAARAWHASVLIDLAARVGDLPYPIAVGALAGVSNIDEDAACAGVLQAFAANLISAAVRLVPLGQSTGLAVLAALEPAITEIAVETSSAALEDIGGAAFRSDIASMRHETQYTRLFRS